MAPKLILLFTLISALNTISSQVPINENLIDTFPYRNGWWEGEVERKFSDGLVLKKVKGGRDYYAYENNSKWREIYPGVVFRREIKGSPVKELRYYNVANQLQKIILVTDHNPYLDSLENIEFGFPNFETHRAPPPGFDSKSATPTNYLCSEYATQPRKNGYVFLVYFLFPIQDNIRLPMESTVKIVSPDGNIVGEFTEDNVVTPESIADDGNLLAYIYGTNQNPYIREIEVRIRNLSLQKLVYQVSSDEKKIPEMLIDLGAGFVRIGYRLLSTSDSISFKPHDLINLNVRERYFKLLPKGTKLQGWTKDPKSYFKVIQNHEFEMFRF
jgi:hypothetical protein